jgi:LacI family transcriptional regulator/LacI family repressor for deo operon, udp, cdd, tsx, nupC, and nupG
MSAPDKRVTQQDVAQLAGVNRATVSLAMRNHPGISPATRAKVQAIAAKLGYRPDPMLSALANYRNSRRPADYRGTLAWLARTTSSFDWRNIRCFSEYLAGARKRAEFHGYQVDVVDVGDPGMTWERAASIIHSRGIRGVILCPQPYPDTDLTSFPWHEFGAITLGYSISQPALHSVAAAQFRASQLVMRKLHERGYRRVGFAMNRSHDHRTDHNYFGGYLVGQALYGANPPVPPFLCDASEARDVVGWFHRHKPDAVLIGTEALADHLLASGLRCPDEVGLACPLLNSSEGDLSGVWESDTRIGEAAVDVLVSIVHRGETGIPDRAQRLLVEGLWRPGKTLKPAPAPTAPAGEAATPVVRLRKGARAVPR